MLGSYDSDSKQLEIVPIPLLTQVLTLVLVSYTFLYNFGLQRRVSPHN